MTAAALEEFRAMSALLTGISSKVLCPDEELLRTLYDAARAGDPETFDRLLLRHREQRGSAPATTIDAILNDSGQRVRFVARSIILAWYLGSWYPPAVLHAASSPSGDGRVDSSTVLSPLAYTSGWVWRIAQAHAMGQIGFMSRMWSTEPPALVVDGAAGGHST